MKQVRIKVVIPNSGMDRDTLDARERMLSRAVSQETRISVDCISRGPISIESTTDEVMAGPYLLEAGRQAQKEGYDAFVVYCFSDLAVDALRENLSIPVVGPGAVALAAAEMLSNRFTVVTTVERNVSRTLRRLKQDPICRDKLAGVRAVNIPVAELREDAQATMRGLSQVCRAAVEEDRADTLVLGCLGLAEYGDALEEKFGVKVVDPAFLAVAWAEMAVRLKLKPSKRSYGSVGAQEGDRLRRMDAGDMQRTGGPACGAMIP